MYEYLSYLYGLFLLLLRTRTAAINDRRATKPTMTPTIIPTLFDDDSVMKYQLQRLNIIDEIMIRTHTLLNYVLEHGLLKCFISRCISHETIDIIYLIINYLLIFECYCFKIPKGLATTKKLNK